MFCGHWHKFVPLSLQRLWSNISSDPMKVVENISRLSHGRSKSPSLIVSTISWGTESTFTYFKIKVSMLWFKDQELGWELEELTEDYETFAPNTSVFSFVKLGDWICSSLSLCPSLTSSTPRNLWMWILLPVVFISYFMSPFLFKCNSLTIHSMFSKQYISVPKCNILNWQPIIVLESHLFAPNT